MSLVLKLHLMNPYFSKHLLHTPGTHQSLSWTPSPPIYFLNTSVYTTTDPTPSKVLLASILTIQLLFVWELYFLLWWSLFKSYIILILSSHHQFHPTLHTTL